MNSVPQPAPKPAGPAPIHAVQLLAEAPAMHRGGRRGHTVKPAAARAGTHVRALAAALVARGLRVTVSGTHSGPESTAVPEAVSEEGWPGPAPAPAADAIAYTVDHAPVPPDTALHAPGVDVVHAHGLWAGALAMRALGRHRQIPLIVSWHTPECAADALWRAVVPVLERRVARAASVVLAGTPKLLDLARHRGARDARLAPTPLRPAEPAPKTYERRGAVPDILVPDNRLPAEVAYTDDSATAPGREAQRPGTPSTPERSLPDTVQHVLSVYDEVLRAAG